MTYLQRARQDVLRLTQGELARELGVSITDIVRWECGAAVIPQAVRVMVHQLVLAVKKGDRE